MLTLIFLCASLPPQAPAAKLPPQAPAAVKKFDPLAAVCRVQAPYKGGTGTVMAPRRPDGKWDVLTAYHVAGGTGSRLEIGLSSGVRVTGVVAATDPEADVAWLVIEHEGDLPAALLATALPRAGAAIRHCGTAQKRGAWVTGGVHGPRGLPGVRGEPLLKVGAPADSGDSGGGVFDAEGRVVSIIWCGDSRDSWGAHCVRIAASRPGKAPASAPTARRIIAPPTAVYAPPVVLRPAPAVIHRPVFAPTAVRFGGADCRT